MISTIVSTHGKFTANGLGTVLETDLTAEFGSRPLYVNWAEWLRAYPAESLPESVDILDVGYIAADGIYTPPCRQWREDRDAEIEKDAKWRMSECLQDNEQHIGRRGVATPGDDDDFQCEFEGVCVGVRNGLLQIRDADNDVFEVDARHFSPLLA